MAGLIARYDTLLFPARGESKKAAVEWLASGKFIDLLENQPDLKHDDLERAIAALSLMMKYTQLWEEPLRPDLGALIRFLKTASKAPSLRLCRRL